MAKWLCIILYLCMYGVYLSESSACQRVVVGLTVMLAISEMWSAFAFDKLHSTWESIDLNCVYRK